MVQNQFLLKTEFTCYNIDKMKRREINNPLIPFENQWVLLAPDRSKVIASGATIKKLNKKLDKVESRDAICTKVLSFDRVFSP